MTRILRDSSITNCIPSHFKNRKPPTVVYKHMNSIRNELFNYASEVKNFDIDHFNVNSTRCSCSSSSFKDPHHGHIVTGDLSIIQNSDLQFLFSQGPNYREQPENVNFNQILKELRLNIEKCTNLLLNLCSSRYSRHFLGA